MAVGVVYRHSGAHAANGDADAIDAGGAVYVDDGRHGHSARDFCVHRIGVVLAVQLLMLPRNSLFRGAGAGRGNDGSPRGGGEDQPGRGDPRALLPV